MNPKKMWVINKKFAIFTAIVLAILVIWYINVQAVKPFANCSQLYAATGRRDISKGDKLYNPAMDRNKNGISCE